MAWQEPITDRAQSDVDYAKTVQSSVEEELKGSLDYRTLNRIEGNTQFLSEILSEYGYPNELSGVITTWDRTVTNFYLSDLNRIISNVNILIAGYISLGLTDITFVTLHEGVGYVKINTIENTLSIIQEYLNNMYKSMPRLGFRLGQKTFGTRGGL